MVWYIFIILKISKLGYKLNGLGGSGIGGKEYFKEVKGIKLIRVDKRIYCSSYKDNRFGILWSRKLCYVGKR